MIAIGGIRTINDECIHWRGQWKAHNFCKVEEKLTLSEERQLKNHVSANLSTVVQFHPRQPLCHVEHMF